MFTALFCKKTEWNEKKKVDFLPEKWYAYSVELHQNGMMQKMEGEI